MCSRNRGRRQCNIYTVVVAVRLEKKGMDEQKEKRLHECMCVCAKSGIIVFLCLANKTQALQQIPNPLS